VEWRIGQKVCDGSALAGRSRHEFDHHLPGNRHECAIARVRRLPDKCITKRSGGRGLSVMEGKGAALVFENDTVMPRRKGSNQRAEMVKLRNRKTIGYISVGATPFEAVTSRDWAGKRGEHAVKLVERPATYHGDGTSEPVSQLSQKSWQLRRHVYQIGRWSDLDEGSVKIEKQSLTAP
jgi:hypothetical protein